jgi:hypothetical protein
MCLLRYYGNAINSILHNSCYYITMEMQQNSLFTTVTITLLWKCNILIVTQQELLRHYGNAIWWCRSCYHGKRNMSQYEEKF